MIVYIGPEQALAVIAQLGLHVRDEGLLASALARPEASMFGRDAYASLELKAAALFSSLAQNHPLFDDNKRLSMILTFSFLSVNGFDTTFTNDGVFELVLQVSQSQIDINEIAETLVSHMRPQL